MLDVIPDSRLKSTIGSVMMDWPLEDGSIVRTEVVPVYCANCGAHSNHYCPKDNTRWAFYLCQDCHDKHGVPAGCLAQPDDAFWADLSYEMNERFGRPLTDLELTYGNIGRNLELLLR